MIYKYIKIYNYFTVWTIDDYLQKIEMCYRIFGSYNESRQGL